MPDGKEGEKKHEAFSEVEQHLSIIVAVDQPDLKKDIFKHKTGLKEIGSRLSDREKVSAVRKGDVSCLWWKQVRTFVVSM
eukprot:scaffold10493_cov93-Cylindrotheca_fusiformis.AAC.2